MKTTVKLSRRLRDAYFEAAVAEVGGKRKSRWVCEALATLERGDRGLATVGLGEHAFVPECAVQVSLREEDVERLRRLVEQVRRQDPLAEGVQSQVLRAAIRWRLERSPGPRPEAITQALANKGKIGTEDFGENPPDEDSKVPANLSSKTIVRRRRPSSS